MDCKVLVRWEHWIGMDLALGMDLVLGMDLALGKDLALGMDWTNKAMHMDYDMVALNKCFQDDH